MFYITVEPGVQIAVYDLNPRGRHTVLLLHGWPLNHSMFEYQLDVLPAQGLRCICMDMRGFGRSDAPWGGYSYDRLADDLYTVLCACNLSGVTLAGFSMGGAVAIRYMARHRGRRVANLALLSAAAPSFVQREGYPYGMTAQQMAALLSALHHDRPQVLHDFGQMFFASPISSCFAQWFRSLALAAPGHSTIHAATTLRDADLRADLAQIRVPTGIFHGQLDQICPFAFAQQMHRGISHSMLYPFERSGHGIFYDELARFNAEFIQFIKQPPSAHRPG